MDKKVELLAPVGSYEAFISAINNGADAIYLAGEHFGAREKATFTNEQIQEMIKYAHIREVRVHVVINTLIYDDEVDKVMEFVDFLYNNDVDAVIVQDLGIITLINKTYPDLEIHASTQLNTMNYKQAKILKELGVKRVILAREANLESVKEILDKVGIDVEVFAHGALCMGYSGQCLLSSFTMKKSGNRGECLQLCRLPYAFMMNEKKIDVNGEYLLSCKDLNTLDYLDKIIESGVTSLKIEGRVKNATYVGKVVSIYRKYIDNYYKNKQIDVEEKDINDLKKVFNREFTKGYLLNEKPRDIVNTFRPNNIGVKIGQVVKVERNKATIKLSDILTQGDGIRFVGNGNDTGMIVNKMYRKGLLVKEGNNEYVDVELKCNVNIKDYVYKTSDVVLTKEIENNNLKITRRFPIDVNVEAYVGKPLIIVASDDLGNIVKVSSDYEIILANKSPTSQERIKEQIAKLNESVYYLNSFDFNGDEMILIPISIINHLRNEMVECLNKKREIINKRKGKNSKIIFDDIEVNKDEFSYMYRVNDINQYEAVKEYTDSGNIYFNKENCIYPFPRINSSIIKPKNECVLINELSDVDTNKYMIANTYLNTANIYALYTLYKLGFKRVTLSLEMGFNRIEALINNYKKVFNKEPNIEVIVYGKIDLMITKYCPINRLLTREDVHCGRCTQDKFFLVDRKGYKLELIKDGVCNTRILNPKKLHLIEYVDKLKKIGISKLRLEFTSESEQEVREVVEGYNEGELELLGVTRGYFSSMED